MMVTSSCGSNEAGRLDIFTRPLAVFVLLVIALEVATFYAGHLLTLYWDLFPSVVGAGLLVFGILLAPFASALWKPATGPLRLRPRAFVIVALLLAVALAIVTALIVLERLPSSADEFGYLFEANTFSAGRLWNAPPRGGQALSPLYVWMAAASGWPSILPDGQPFSLLGVRSWVIPGRPEPGRSLWPRWRSID